MYKPLPTLTQDEEARAIEQIARVPLLVKRVQIPVCKGKTAVFEESDGLWYLQNPVRIK